MRILFLSFYFQPDLCAGSFRNTPLAEKLAERLRVGDEVDVLTTLPNRYQEFSADAGEYEDRGVLKIRRFRISAHKSGMVDQSLAFAAYAKHVLRVSRCKRYDLIFASSSRLMTAALGAFLARRDGIPLYLDIRDLFADTIKDVLHGPLSACLGPGIRMVEKFTFKTATRINLVSEGFADYLRKKCPDVSLSFFTNGVDSEFLDRRFCDAPSEVGETDRKTLVYAGNIGEGQGLHHIVPPLARALGEDWQIIVVGSGGGLKKLKDALEAAHVTNVMLKPPVARQEILDLYYKATCLFLHLNSHPAFHRVLPSKIFEYAATGKPILAGVSGFSADFINREIANAESFPPCETHAAVQALSKLKFSFTDRSDFIQRHLRDTIMDRMADDILRTSEKVAG